MPQVRARAQSRQSKLPERRASTHAVTVVCSSSRKESTAAEREWTLTTQYFLLFCVRLPVSPLGRRSLRASVCVRPSAFALFSSPLQNNVPWCFYPITTTPVYTVASLSQNGAGFTAELTLSNPGSGTYGPALSSLTLTASYETASRAHFRLTNSNEQRYEIPQSILPYPQQGSKDFPAPGQKGAYSPEDAAFTVQTAAVGSALSLTVTRTLDGTVIFDLADLEYSDQFLQLSTILPDSASASGPNLYGLGEHVMQFRLPTDDHSFTMWNVDIPTPYDQNIYGA